jgi:hypothetical protein
MYVWTPGLGYFIILGLAIVAGGIAGLLHAFFKYGIDYHITIIEPDGTRRYWPRKR